MKEVRKVNFFLCICSYDIYLRLVKVSKNISTDRKVIRGHGGRTILRTFLAGTHFGTQ